MDTEVPILIVVKLAPDRQTDIRTDSITRYCQTQVHMWRERKRFKRNIHQSTSTYMIHSNPPSVQSKPGASPTGGSGVLTPALLKTGRVDPPQIREWSGQNPVFFRFLGYFGVGWPPCRRFDLPPLKHPWRRPWSKQKQVDVSMQRWCSATAAKFCILKSTNKKHWNFMIGILFFFSKRYFTFWCQSTCTWGWYWSFCAVHRREVLRFEVTWWPAACTSTTRAAVEGKEGRGSPYRDAGNSMRSKMTIGCSLQQPLNDMQMKAASGQLNSGKNAMFKKYLPSL